MAGLQDVVRSRLESAAGIQRALEATAPKIVAVAGAMIRSLRTGGKIVLFGNGGSAADAQHIAGELVGRYYLDRRPLSAMALTVNTSSLTAIANDHGFAQVFARQLESVGRGGDVAIGISTSGRSANVLEALRVARRLGMVSVLLTGRGGEDAAAADYCLAVPSSDTPRIQEAHILIGHLLCELVEANLCGPLSVQTVFLERDGVVNPRNAGRDPVRWADFEFLPGAKEALSRLSARQIRLIIVTNQQGIVRGQLTEAELEDLHGRMLFELSREGARIDGVYYCPHDEGECACRKPRTGLFLRAQADFPDIEFERAAVIGDSLHDVEAGARLGCRTILVGEGARAAAVAERAGRRHFVIDRVVPSLFNAAVEHLLADSRTATL